MRPKHKLHAARLDLAIKAEDNHGHNKKDDADRNAEEILDRLALKDRIVLCHIYSEQGEIVVDKFLCVREPECNVRPTGISCGISRFDGSVIRDDKKKLHSDERTNGNYRRYRDRRDRLFRNDAVL